MEIYLVRHGESADNAERRIQGQAGAGLTDRGRAEAAAAAEYLATQGLSRLFASDLRRAAETANVLERRLGLDAEPDAAFREMALGPWEGRTMSSVEADDALALWSWRYDGRRPASPGVEPVGAVLGRVLGALERVRAALEPREAAPPGAAPSAGSAPRTANGEPPRRAAVVTHGGVISITLTHLIGLDCVRIWQMPTVNGSISRLAWERGAWRVVSWNETAHLPNFSEGMTTI